MFGSGEVSEKLSHALRVEYLFISVTPRIASLFEKLACAYDSQLSSAGEANMMQLQ